MTTVAFKLLTLGVVDTAATPAADSNGKSFPDFCTAYVTTRHFSLSNIIKIIQKLGIVSGRRGKKNPDGDFSFRPRSILVFYPDIKKNNSGSTLPRIMRKLIS